MTKVIQWATGVTGMMALRHIVGRPDLELVASASTTPRSPASTPVSWPVFGVPAW